MLPTENSQLSLVPVAHGRDESNDRFYLSPDGWAELSFSLEILVHPPLCILPLPPPSSLRMAEWPYQSAATHQIHCDPDCEMGGAGGTRD